jgi:hypothetical protein
MRQSLKERLLVAIIAALLITIVLIAAALFRFAGRAHLLIVPDLSAPRSKSKVLHEGSKEWGTEGLSVRATFLPYSFTPSSDNFMSDAVAGMFGVTESKRCARLGVSVRSTPGMFAGKQMEVRP